MISRTRKRRSGHDELLQIANERNERGTDDQTEQKRREEKMMAETRLYKHTLPVMKG